ncbi:DUF1573 domain-containing protein [candidate division KSB1 bacterium]|nr:DUF1573 domain-containing protein [candidate division KSB1 bacterium]
MKNTFLLMLLVLPITLVIGSPSVEYLTPTLIDFGEVSEGELLHGEIRFVNSGDEEVVVDNVRPSCGCTVTHLETKSFAPGDTAKIPFTLNTSRFKGTIRKTIRVYFKDKNLTAEIFTIQAKIITELDLSPSYIHFKDVKANPDTVITQFAKFANNSDVPIKIKIKEYNNDLIRIKPEKFEVPAGETYLVRVELMPKQAKRANTTVIFDTDFEKKPSCILYVYHFIKE